MRWILVLTGLISIAIVKGSPELSYFQRVFLGYLGTLYMVAFLLSYSARKRIKKLRKNLRILPGKSVKDSLGLHILTGLLGPGIILLHTSLSFNGLAGISAGLMVVVVISGITGRYIFIKVRKMERVLKKNKDISGSANGTAALISLEKMRSLLGRWRSVHIPLTTIFFVTVILHILSVYYY